MTGKADPVIASCQFQENRAGLTLVRQARGEIRNNTARLNQFGLTISDQAAPFVNNNQLVENRCGMAISGAASPVLRGNVIAQNSQDGLAVFGQATPDLGQFHDPAGNRLRDNHRFDLRNATALKLVSLGNQLNPVRVNGFVEFATARSPLASDPWPSPQPPIRLYPTDLLRHAPVDLQPHWAARLVQPLLDRQVLPAPSEGRFQPDAGVMPAELADWMRRAGLTPAGALASAAPLSRLQVMVCLAEALQLPQSHPSLLQGYRDRAQIPSDQTLAAAAALQQLPGGFSPA